MGRYHTSWWRSLAFTANAAAKLLGELSLCVVVLPAGMYNAPPTELLADGPLREGDRDTEMLERACPKLRAARHDDLRFFCGA
jgi:hypothetical protein